MIQRIQTLYLLISVVLLALMLFFPLVEFANEEGVVFLLSAFGIDDLQNTGALVNVQTYPVSVILLVIVAVNLVAVFLHKKRLLQLRFCVYNMVFMLGALVVIYFYSSQIASQTGTSIQYAWPSIMPIISVILTLLAIRGIRKDIKLLRSAERIR